MVWRLWRTQEGAVDMPVIEVKSKPAAVSMQNVRRQRRQRLATRMSLVVVLSLRLVVCLVVASIWLYRVLYRDNPHFILRELDVKETVHFNQKNVQEILESYQEYPCVIGKTSILNLDLGKVRAAFLRYPLVKDATVQRVMPNILEIEIKERSAIAFLSSGEKVDSLIDDNGICFPYDGTDGLDLPLPFIIVAKGLAGIPMGVPVEDVGINGAIALINEISARPKIDGAGYAVNLVKINSDRERLEVWLRPLSGNMVFPKGAQVWIPWDKEKQLEALARLEQILVRKISDSETLSFADVTLQYNVPTRD